MNPNKWELTRNKIMAAPIPDETRTYSPIPHSLFLDELGGKLDTAGYVITNERYLSADNYQIVTGTIAIKKKNDTPLDLTPSLYFVNSYNKTRRASLKAGAMVLVCKNGMLGSVENASYSRLHKGTALQDFRKEMDSVIASVETEFHRLETNVVEMKETHLSKKIIAQLVGDMYLNELLINNEQLSILKKELAYSEHFKNGTLWDFYNNCTEAYKSSHPNYYEKQHIKLHTYISDKFNLTGHRGLYGEAIEDISYEVSE